MRASRWMAAWGAALMVIGMTACVDDGGRDSSGTTVRAQYADDGLGSSVSPGPAEAARSSTSPAAVARAFLAAWEAGDLPTAVALASPSGPAATGLANFRDHFGSPTMKFTMHEAAPAAVTVPFTATLTWAPGEVWTYESVVTIVPDGIDWKVKWSSAILHPRLTGLKHIDVVEVPAAAASPLDRMGQTLSAGSYPSLAGVLTKVNAVGTATVGTTGKSVNLVDPADRSSISLATLAPPGASAGLTTTIDAKVQAAAERAVAGSAPTTGLIVVQPSTGHILAMANNPPGQQNVTTSMQPPGSTMKVIVASALFNAGDGPGSPVPCPERITVDGRAFANDDPNDTNPSASLSQDFTVSCNTAFINEGRAKLTAAIVSAEAANTFGITKPWDIGLHEPRAYGSVPDAGLTTTEWAAGLIGQGKVTMSPLAMASVAATVANGSFHQPVLLPDAPRVTANGLSPGAAANLRTMMRNVVTSGTATSLRGVPGVVGAKTGTAESAIGTNGWMIAFRGDLAVACEVFGGGSGDGSAGLVVATFLRSLPV